MNMGRDARQPQESVGTMALLWKHKLWWMLPLGVLLLLLIGIYALEHLSKTDSEMYPTSTKNFVTFTRLC